MSVNEQDRAYKRGVVLGLTLAEVVILVIFCLLLALVLPWKLGAKPNDAAAGSRESYIAQLERLRGTTPEEVFWRTVIIAFRQYRSVAEAKGSPAPSNSGPTPPNVVEEVVREMEQARGSTPLEEYWRRLRWASEQESELREALKREIDARKQAEARASASEARAGKAEERIERVERESGESAVRRLREENKALEARISELESRLRKADEDLRRCVAREQACQTALKGRGQHDWPPIINLKEAAGYSFKTAESALTKEFEERLRNEVVPKILEYIKEFGTDVVEVVGHTDERPMQGAGSNLDIALLPLLNNPRTATMLHAVDNTGLGMARAAIVVRFLRSDERLAPYRDRILPLSSGQVLDESGKLADGSKSKDQPERRRIEIRLRRDVR